MRVDYFVSGVWKEHNTVTHLFVHKNTTEGFTQGSKMSLREVVAIINEGFTVHAIKWEYESGRWSVLASVQVMHTREGLEYLHTMNHNNMVPLENLVNMKSLVAAGDTHQTPLIRHRTKSDAKQNVLGK